VDDAELFREVDAHLDALYPPETELEAGQRRAAAAGMPAIAVSAQVGRLLLVLARARGARRILEVGTLAGYSTTWLARALPVDGELVTLELSEHHAEVARANLAAAGVADRVTVRVGPALDSLRQLAEEGGAPFDLVFIDADKPPYVAYLEAALELSAPGTLVVADNVVRAGRILHPEPDDEAVRGVQRFGAYVAAHPRLDSAIVQVVGEKGHDGLAFVVVRDA
jgi:predicted O-methyltransferase YrrM